MSARRRSRSIETGSSSRVGGDMLRLGTRGGVRTLLPTVQKGARRLGGRAGRGAPRRGDGGRGARAPPRGRGSGSPSAGGRGGRSGGPCGGRRRGWDRAP